MRVRQEQFGPVLSKLKMYSEFAVDTETTGLEIVDRPFALIVATKDHVYYFDERDLGPVFWKQFEWLFDNPLNFIAFQNAKFDMRMLGHMGITITAWCYDTNIGARLLRNDHMEYSLDAQAKRYLKAEKDGRVKAYIEKHNLYETRVDEFGEGYSVPCYHKVPIELMAEYAERDARLTFDLYAKYKNELDRESLEVWEEESELNHVCLKMEHLGLLLNLPYTREAMNWEQSKLFAAKRAFEIETNSAFVDSAKSMQKHFTYQFPLTDKGNPSLTDEVLESIKASVTGKDRLLAELLQEARFYAKRVDTYYRNYINAARWDGIVHPQMWIGGTRTGRFSYSEPNLQNMPKEEESQEQFVVRGCFKPRVGHVYVSFDYSQMEYRMMAAYANEAGIIKQVMDGEDFHKVTAEMFGVSRKTAKTLNFMILYGGGNVKLANSLGVTTEEATRLKYKYFMALPRVEKFVDEVIRTAKSRGYVKNWCGRRLHTDKEFAYAAPNHLIQSGGADVVKRAMRTIHNKLPDLRMVLQVHDQLVFEVRPDQYQLLQKVKDIMEGVFPEMNGMKLTVDVSWSPTSLAERDMQKGFPS